jgi:hypothetical protein
MYVPNADGVGVPTYFVPTERHGATVGKHPGPWLVGGGGGLTNMLLTPHEGEGGGVGIDVSFWSDVPIDRLNSHGPDEDGILWISNGTDYNSHFRVLFTPPIEGVGVECGWNEFPLTEEELRVVPARIPGWSGKVFAELLNWSGGSESFYVSEPSEESFDVRIEGYGYAPLPSNPSIEFTFPAGLFYIGDETSDEIVINVPLDHEPA